MLDAINRQQSSHSPQLDLYPTADSGQRTTGNVEQKVMFQYNYNRDAISVSRLRLRLRLRLCLLLLVAVVFLVLSATERQRDGPG